MKDEIDVDGKLYVSTKRAARETGYTHDYVGQLTRAGNVPGKLVGRTKFVDIEALKEYKHQAETHKKKNAESRSTKFKAGRLVPLSVSNNRTTYASREEMSRRDYEKIKTEEESPRKEGHLNAEQVNEEQSERQEVMEEQGAPMEEERQPVEFEVLTKSLEEIDFEDEAPAVRQKKSAPLVRAAVIFLISFFAGAGSTHIFFSMPAVQSTVFSVVGIDEYTSPQNNTANTRDFLDRETRILEYELAYIGAVMEYRFLSMGEDVNTLGRLAIKELYKAPRTTLSGYEAYSAALRQFSRAVAEKQVAYVRTAKENIAKFADLFLSDKVIFEQSAGN